MKVKNERELKEMGKENGIMCSELSQTAPKKVP